MNGFRLWLVKRDEQVSGPFPAQVICQEILIGRIRENDLISIDGHAWHAFRDVPEIYDEIAHLLDLHAESHDAQWHEERVRAALRHWDERKRPDRREHENISETSEHREESADRRVIPETAEQQIYRHHVAEVDHWLRRYRVHYGWAAAALLAATLAIGLALHYFQATTPIDIGLGTAKACELPPARGVNWHACNKSGYLLAGADLRQANLKGADLSGANLSYANLMGADLTDTNLAHAQLQGATLQEALLTGAVWTDGRICQTGSVGVCR